MKSKKEIKKIILDALMVEIGEHLIMKQKNDIAEVVVVETQDDYRLQIVNSKYNFWPFDLIYENGFERRGNDILSSLEKEELILRWLNNYGHKIIGVTKVSEEGEFTINCENVNYVNCRDYQLSFGGMKLNRFYTLEELGLMDNEK